MIVPKIASCPYLCLMAQLAQGCVWLCMNNMTTLVRALRLSDGLWLRCALMWGNVSALTPGRGLKWCSRHLLAQWSPVRSYQELNDNWPSIWHKHWSLSWYHWVNLFTSLCSSYICVFSFQWYLYRLRFPWKDYSLLLCLFWYDLFPILCSLAEAQTGNSSNLLIDAF